MHLHRGTSCLFIGICTTVRTQRYQAEHLGIISGLRGEDVGDERKEILGCCAFAPPPSRIRNLPADGSNFRENSPDNEDDTEEN